MILGWDGNLEKYLAGVCGHLHLYLCGVGIPNGGSCGYCFQALANILEDT
jgi:hypothetical protein